MSDNWIVSDFFIISQSCLNNQPVNQILILLFLLTQTTKLQNIYRSKIPVKIDKS